MPDPTIPGETGSDPETVVYLTKLLANDAPTAPLTLFRFHRGTLEDSMATVRPIASRAELVSIINAEMQQPVTEADISVEFYRHDERIGWDYYVVMAHGGVVGFANKEI